MEKVIVNPVKEDLKGSIRLAEAFGISDIRSKEIHFHFITTVIVVEMERMLPIIVNTPNDFGGGMVAVDLLPAIGRHVVVAETPNEVAFICFSFIEDIKSYLTDDLESVGSLGVKEMIVHFLEQGISVIKRDFVDMETYLSKAKEATSEERSERLTRAKEALKKIIDKMDR